MASSIIEIKHWKVTAWGRNVIREKRRCKQAADNVEILGMVAMEKESTEVSKLQVKIIPKPK